MEICVSDLGFPMHTHRTDSPPSFRLIEMQSILVDLIENFEFSPLEGVRVMRVFTGGMMNAMVEGRYHEGTQMPLQVSLVQH